MHSMCTVRALYHRSITGRRRACDGGVSLGYTPEHIHTFAHLRCGSGGGSADPAPSQWRLQHGGCVNTASWDDTGAFLVTGSDDRLIKIWKLDMAGAGMALRATLATGHRRNIFDAQWVPGQPSMLMTCAMDGELRHHRRVGDGDERESFLIGHAAGILHGLRWSGRERPWRAAATDPSDVCTTLRLRCPVSSVHPVRRLSRCVAAGFAFLPSSPHVVLTAQDDGVVARYDVRLPCSPKRAVLWSNGAPVKAVHFRPGPPGALPCMTPP